MEVKNVEEINEEILALKNNNISTDNISNGVNTFGEYIDLIDQLFVALCNAYPELSFKCRSHGEKNDNCIMAGIWTRYGYIFLDVNESLWDSLLVEEIDYQELMLSPEIVSSSKQEKNIILKEALASLVNNKNPEFGTPEMEYKIEREKEKLLLINRKDFMFATTNFRNID